LNTTVRRRWPWTARVGRGLSRTVCRRRTWAARIGRGLRNIGRDLVDNMRMTMPYKYQKSVNEAPFMHNNIFNYFPSSILKVSASRGSFVPIFITFTVYYILSHILRIKIYKII